MPGPTLEILDGDVWAEPTYHSSLVETCHRLRKKPIAEFTPADLRIMIGQRIGLPHLIPPALALLEREPMIDAFFFPGDLLAAAVEADDWLCSRHELRARLDAIVRRALDSPELESSELRVQFDRFLADAPR